MVVLCMNAVSTSEQISKGIKNERKTKMRFAEILKYCLRSNVHGVPLIKVEGIV